MDRVTAHVTWRIDDHLRLEKIPSLPPTAAPLHRPEELIDTLLVRNLDHFCTAVFGVPGVFLFDSSQCWGHFDVGALLRDGRPVCIENKRGRPTAADMLKFARDVRFVSEHGLLYLMHRHQHHIARYHEYVETAMQTFAGSYLGIRTRTVPSSRDLMSEAAALLRISRSELERRAAAASQWLANVRRTHPEGNEPSQSMYDYVRLQEIQLRADSPVFVLLAAGAELTDLPTHIAAPTQRHDKAMLVSYRFFNDGVPYPTHLALRVEGEFFVQDDRLN